VGHFFFQLGQQVGILVDQLKIGFQLLNVSSQLLVDL
jgi:hypothetical protein